MNEVLAMLDDETARQVANDIRTYGHGYVRFDREGRATFVPAYAVVQHERDERQPARMHE